MGSSDNPNLPRTYITGEELYTTAAEKAIQKLKEEYKREETERKAKEAAEREMAFQGQRESDIYAMGDYLTEDEYVVFRAYYTGHKKGEGKGDRRKVYYHLLIPHALEIMLEFKLSDKSKKWGVISEETDEDEEHWYTWFTDFRKALIEATECG